VKKPMAHVTDHAVLRYLVRDELGRVVDRAIELGAGATIIDGVKYILNDRTIVTCTEVKQVPLRGRAMRRRERAVKQDWEGEE